MTGKGPQILAALLALLVLGVLGAPAAQAAKKTTRKASAASLKPNTGKRGSPCVATPYQGPGAGPDAALDTASLGPSAPAPYEIGLPTSAPEVGRPPQRVMMLIHGGGWYTVGVEAMRTERRAAALWADAGWATVSIDYRACGKSRPDALLFYDLVRARFGPVPICLTGESAGGQLALMIAADRPDVACVLVQGTPTDFMTIAGEGRREARAGGSAPELRKGSAFVGGVARAAFGAGALKAQSPVSRAADIRARVLIGTASGDPVIPYEQADEMFGAMRNADPNAYVDVPRLAAGPVLWTHGLVTQAAVDDFAARAEALVSPFGRAPGVAAPAPPKKLDLFGFLRRLFGG